MTDNQSDVSNTKTDHEPQTAQNSPKNEAQTQEAAINKSVVERRVSANDISDSSQSSKPVQTKAAVAKEPQMKKVEITIASGKYPIYCPVHEEEELRSAVSYINTYALELRAEAPNLSQENLLVLCCLNLYEKINGNNKDNEARRNEHEKTQGLLDKIIKDARSIL
ncbi:cell division protein ZapA [Psychrobacter sp. DM4]|uniref:cell division protein ZapA n=1 Tax=Psychrobacter sp. DM4 TaxID=3440637 RepID=UPI003F4F95C7